MQGARVSGAGHASLNTVGSGFLFLSPEDPVGTGCAWICDGDKTNGAFHTSGRAAFLWLGLSCIDRIAIGNICLYLYNT